MALATKPRQRSSRPHSFASRSTAGFQASHDAREEIAAYIAVRDGLLEEAEKELTETALERLIQANQFVAHCLKPARLPYQAQSLPEVDAAREMKRCQTVDARIAQMRARTAATARA
jgi:hypothetical protein